MNIFKTPTKWGITLRTFRCGTPATCPTDCSKQTKIGQSVVGTTRNYQSYLSISRIHSIITHTHPQLISRYDRHTSDPFPKDQTSVVQHGRYACKTKDHVSAKISGKPKTARAPKYPLSRRPHEHQNAHESENRTSTKIPTEPKTARAPKYPLSRRPHEHQNAHEAEGRTSTKNTHEAEDRTSTKIPIKPKTA